MNLSHHLKALGSLLGNFAKSNAAVVTGVGVGLSLLAGAVLLSGKLRTRLSGTLDSLIAGDPVPAPNPPAPRHNNSPTHHRAGAGLGLNSHARRVVPPIPVMPLG
jgi:hypothetical protein